MHLGEEDEFIPKTAQAQIKAALAKKAERNRLQLSGSGVTPFSRHNGTHYNATAGRIGEQRTNTREFLNQHLAVTFVSP